MKLFSSAIAVYRSFSTKTIGKSKKCSQSGYQKKKNKWTDEQSRVLAAISRGESVFITGCAGTGKTSLVRHIIKLLNKIHGQSEVFVTASTGVAACALEGQTLHSFAGIGLGQVECKTLLNRVLLDENAYGRWNTVKALVIDEISMVSAELFDKLEYIAREVRGEQHAVWGGIQLVVSGDFFQLPPILSKRKPKGGKEFAFEADCWNSTFDVQVELTKNFRQADEQLIKFLQGIRRGECDPEDLQLMEKCSLEIEPDSSVVQLYPMNKDVNRVNEKLMMSLEEEIGVYHALDTGKDPWKKQLKQGIAPDTLEVCVGARVMLSKNINVQHKLVNGATGTVKAFYDPGGDAYVLPVVKFDSGPELVIYPETWIVMEGEEVKATRKQIPLILAWALSIHKCQGMTLNSLHTDLSRAFGCGMVYVALSRVRSLDGLHLSGFDPSKVKAHPKVLQFYQSFASKKDKQDKQGANRTGLEGEETKNWVHLTNYSTNTDQGEMVSLSQGTDSESCPIPRNEAFCRILGTKIGYERGLGYGAKPTQSTHSNSAEVEAANKRANEAEERARNAWLQRP